MSKLLCTLKKSVFTELFFLSPVYLLTGIESCHLAPPSASCLFQATFAFHMKCVRSLYPSQRAHLESPLCPEETCQSDCDPWAPAPANINTDKDE